VEAFRFIGRALGEEDERELRLQRVACHVPYGKNAIFFKGKTFKVAVGTDSLLLTVTRLANNNPVLVIDEDGNEIRYHGEIIHLWEELQQSVCSLFEDRH
jgi:hypothetical protein